MGSRSDVRSADSRPRPTPELIARLRQGKADLHRERQSLPLREKVRGVLALQRLHYPLLVRQRRPEDWERPWEVEP